MRKLFIAFILLLIWCDGYNQVVYEHISRSNIYDFLDELANDKIIEINSVIKPYSRMFIAEKLLEAQGKSDQLTKRQQKDIEFYMKDYRLEVEYNTKGMKPLNLFPKSDHLATALNPLGLHYRDSVFALSIRPIWGISYLTNENGSNTHTWGGLEGFGYIAKNVGLYSSLRDNNENEILTDPGYFVQKQGVPYKYFGEEGIDYSEARGGLIASWKWGHAGIVKDHMEWGNNYYGSNILSGRTPSFAHIKLNLKPIRWFEFNYFHGWLVSNVIDSSRSYWDGNEYRTVLHSKYIAANMFTFYPVRYLNFSFGNSIVYSDIGIHAAYLVPFLFYKSVDHTLNNTNSTGQSGQNSQMFLDISSRNLKHLHVFMTVFVDEFSIDRLSVDSTHNFISYKWGGRLSNWPVKNLSLMAEYTYTLPLVYQHNISTTTYASNLYNLGHYMTDNSQNLYLMLRYKPIRGLSIDLFYDWAQHGDDLQYGDPGVLDAVPVLENITWQKSIVGMNAKYEFLNNAYLFAGVTFSNIEGFDYDDRTAQEYLDQFTPVLMQGKTTTVNFGFNIGF